MRDKKLRPWFVTDDLPRHEDYKKKLSIGNVQSLRSTLEEMDSKRKDIRMYLGKYEIGKLWYTSKSFIISETKELGEVGNGIFDMFERIFCEEVEISDVLMEKVLQDGISLEEFIYTIFDDKGVDVAIADDPMISTALIQSGYMLLLALKDAVHIDSRDKHKDDSLLFIKFRLRDFITECTEERLELPMAENKLWFVRDSEPRNFDYNTGTVEVTSSQKLSTLNKEFVEPIDSKIKIRVYLGEYEIGGLTVDERKRRFYFLSTSDFVVDSFGARTEQVFGINPFLTYKQMDDMLGKELFIEEFIETSMNKCSKVFITDNSECIWKLLHDGYRVICLLNDILHQDVKNNPAFIEKYKRDKRVILIKIT